MAKVSSKEEQKLSKWQHEIEVARKHRLSFLHNWNYYEQMFDDNLWGLSDQKFDKRHRKSTQNNPNFTHQVNVVDPMIMSILPKIHIFSPVFEVRSVYNEFAFRFSALVWESVADIYYELLEMYDSV